MCTVELRLHWLLNVVRSYIVIITIITYPDVLCLVLTTYNVPTAEMQVFSLSDCEREWGIISTMWDLWVERWWRFIFVRFRNINLLQIWCYCSVMLSGLQGQTTPYKKATQINVNVNNWRDQMNGRFSFPYNALTSKQKFNKL